MTPRTKERTPAVKSVYPRFTRTMLMIKDMGERMNRRARLFLVPAPATIVAPPPTLPPTLRATLVVVHAIPAPPLEELQHGPGIEGVEWSQSWPQEGIMLLRIPLLLSGARLKAFLHDALGGPAIAREMREFRILLDAAREALTELTAKPGQLALLALADALEPLPGAITMLEVQRRLRRALGSSVIEIASLSHYDSLILSPADLDASWIRAGIEGAYASLASGPVAVIVRPLAKLEALLPRLPLR